MKFKVNVPLIIEADDADNAHASAVAAVADVDQKDGVEFFLESVADADTVEELDEDNLSEGEEEVEDEVEVGDETGEEGEDGEEGEETI